MARNMNKAELVNAIGCPPRLNKGLADGVDFKFFKKRSHTFSFLSQTYFCIARHALIIPMLKPTTIIPTRHQGDVPNA